MTDSKAFSASGATVRLLQALTLVGGGTLAAGLFLAPQRTWAGLLLVSFYLVGLGLGSLLWVALHYVTGARWSVALRRVPEAMASVLPVAAVALAVVLLCWPSLYPWSTSAFPEGYTSPMRQLWLTRPFFLLRAVVYLTLWLAFAKAIVRTSRRQDLHVDPAPTRKNIGLSAAFLVVFGITCWLASHDWIMSLEPGWASTIFGVYNFAGLFVSSLAAATLLVIWLRPRSALQAVVTDDHLHDLGTLVFAFSSFWMYAWFCQYMLIWYVNNPEETAYYLRRTSGTWPLLSLLCLVLIWGIPFLVLLFRRFKRNALVLSTVCVAVLAGRWLDLFLMIFPSQGEAVAIPGPIEAGLALGAAGVFLLVFFRGLGKASLVPRHDPFCFEPHVALVDHG
ncbi:MAG TPA: hypothetical protein VND64_31270 [Pirellulales bacterium]|nr:hypothetical protein [Pirellulales bacterium]